jgi:photosystem II stability/assembly factor-like uncharacterized protein
MPTSGVQSSGPGDSASALPAGSGGLGSVARGICFATAAAIFLMSSWVAVQQQPRADAYRLTTPLDQEWWLRPVEINAPRRLPLVWADLNDVFVLPGKGQVGPQVWVVGAGGLILHSPDSGRSWQQQHLLKAPSPGAQPAASAPRAAGMSPVEAASLLAVILPPAGKPAEVQLASPQTQTAPTSTGSGSVPTGQRALGERGVLLLVARDAEDHPISGLRFAHAGVLSPPTDLAGATRLELPPGLLPGQQITIELVPGGKLGDDWFLVNPRVNVPTGATSVEVVLMRRSAFRQIAAEVRGSPAAAAPRPSEQAAKGNGQAQNGPNAEGTPAGAVPNQAQPPVPPVDELAKVDLWSVWFTDERTGWVAGDQGVLFATRDGGKTWQLQRTHPIDTTAPAWTSAGPPKLFFEDASRGFLANSEGCFKTQDGGRRWSERKVSRGSAALCGQQQMAVVRVGSSLSVTDLRLNASMTSGWAVGKQGYISPLAEAISPPGPPLAVPTREDLLGLDLIGEQIVWAVGDHGTAIATHDNGKNWAAASTGTRAKLQAVHFLDTQHGWIVGAAGTLLATVDGGTTWFRQTRLPPDLPANEAAPGPHSIWPAPWYYLSLILVAGLLVPALLPAPPRVDPQPSVADRLISDRAIDRSDADAFDFNAVALGLSRFLRNAKTEPPLTIAITGEWGSGKSSLMNLLRGDLRRYGFRPVWFNAWHHQKEEHLLASLLEAVRAEAVPPWWRPEGALLRAKLLHIRWARSWPLVALLLLAFSFSAGYIRADPHRLETAQQGLDALLDQAKIPLGLHVDSAADLAHPQSETEGSAKRLPLTALLVTAVGVAAAVLRGAKAFGVSPASLLARRSTRVRDLEALTGFRHRFAAEFSDVTAALNPRTMLILIDDLDRCRPEMVLEVLEAVNFLVSSGDCFVVLGMARDRVLRCVGLSFKDVANELLDPPAAAPAGLTQDDLARQRRLEFAQQYLEKLINIEVPVPLPTNEQSRRLMVESDPPSDLEPQRSPRWQALAHAARRSLPAAALTAFLIGGFFYGLTRRPSPTPQDSAPSTAAAMANEGSGAAQGVAGGNAAPKPPPGFVGPPPPPAAAAKPLGRPPIPADPVRWPRWPYAILALVLAGLGAWRFSLPPDVVIHDSREFAEALARWHPLIFSWRNTPRAVKRYLNRVRFLAMLQREPAAAPAVWRRLGGILWQHPLAHQPPESPAPIPEQVLVALSAIELRQPAWISDTRSFAACAREAGGEIPPGIEQLLAEPARAGELEFFRHRYRELARGVRTGGEEHAA